MVDAGIACPNNIFEQRHDRQWSDATTLRRDGHVVTPTNIFSHVADDLAMFSGSCCVDYDRTGLD